MSEDRKKLDKFILATGQRVNNWSDAQREAFEEATKKKDPERLQAHKPNEPLKK